MLMDVIGWTPAKRESERELWVGHDCWTRSVEVEVGILVIIPYPFLRGFAEWRKSAATNPSA